MNRKDSSGPDAAAPRAHLVDDDPALSELLAHRLAQVGFQVSRSHSVAEAVARFMRETPRGAVVAIILQGIEGLELCQHSRADNRVDSVRIIVISGEGDRHRALDLGADAFIPKPLDSSSFPEQVQRVIEDRIHLIFWGVRGTLPVPGPGTVRYGGNTSCVSLEACRGPLLVFDAGTGIKALSDHLQLQGTGVEAKILISHPHWDHINALPFFRPLYNRGSAVEILGPCQGDKCVEAFIREQMDGVYFPITAREFGAQVSYRSLGEESLTIDRLSVRTMRLNHPGHCLGYRVDYENRSVCYVTDNEIPPAGLDDATERYRRRLERFVGASDVLIADSTYTDEEYLDHVNWGHSPLSAVVELAHRAQVATLCLFHHDPDQDDRAIDTKLDQACARLRGLGSATRCIAPADGDPLEV